MPKNDAVPRAQIANFLRKAGPFGGLELEKKFEYGWRYVGPVARYF
jgi:hypothetical protein